MAETKLTPCPFCGSKDIRVWSEFAACKQCGTWGPKAISMEDAIRLWNRRADKAGRGKR